MGCRVALTMAGGVSTLLLLLLLLAPRTAVARDYAAIFNFGDSLVDAGNLVTNGIPDYLATARLPYGQTYFGYPTGRCSDGRLVIDFIAQELGLPLLPPSKARNATFHRGANFAITGATSLDTPFFQARGLGQTVWNSGSLHTQIQWFRDMKPSICSNSTQECRELFRRSLFVVGEFGGNDYNSPLFAFRPMEEVYTFVPHVVDSIASGVEELIAEGAVELVVPGVLPIGCFPVYLSIFRKPQGPDAYGARSGCIREMNTLSWVHNAALQRRIVQLRAKHPRVRIVYADYYTPAIQFVLHADKWGWSPTSRGRQELPLGLRWCATRARGRCSGSTGWCSCCSSSSAGRRCTPRGGVRTSAPATSPSSTTSARRSPPSTSTARERPGLVGEECDVLKIELSPSLHDTAVAVLIYAGGAWNWNRGYMQQHAWRGKRTVRLLNDD